MDDNLRLATLQKLKDTYPDNWDEFKTKLSGLSPDKVEKYLETKSQELGLSKQSTMTDFSQPKPDETELEYGKRLSEEYNLGSGSAFLRAAGRTALLGQAEEMYAGLSAGLQKTPLKGLSEGRPKEEIIRREEAIGKALAKEHPVSNIAGGITGFMLNPLSILMFGKIGGGVAKKLFPKTAEKVIESFGKKGIQRYIPKINWKEFKNFFYRSMTEAGTGFGLYSGTESALEGDKPLEVAKKTVLGGLGGAVAGSIPPLALGVGAVVAKPVLVIGGKAITGTMKGITKLLAAPSKDLKDMVKNVVEVVKYKTEEARSKLFAEEAKHLSTLRDKTIDKFNGVIKEAKGKVVNALNLMRTKTEAAKLTAVNNLAESIDISMRRLNKEYGKGINPILKESGDLPVDLTETRNMIINLLSKERAITKNGKVLEGSSFALAYPKLANVLFNYYERLGGVTAIKRKDLALKSTMKLRDAINFKQEIAPVAGYLKGGAEGATKQTFSPRRIYRSVRTATEDTDMRLSPLNESYSQGINAIHKTRKIVGEEDDNILQFVYSLATSKNKELAKSKLLSMKGKISQDVDFAIDKVMRYHRKYNEMKGAWKLERPSQISFKGGERDSEKLLEILSVVPKLKKAIEKGESKENIIKLMETSIGKQFSKPAKMEKLLAEFDMLAEKNRLNDQEAIKSIANNIPEIADVIIRTTPARLAQRVYQPIATELLGFKGLVPWGRTVIKNYKLLVGKLIESMYTGSISRMNQVLEFAPEGIQRLAQNKGAKVAFYFWAQDPRGEMQIREITNVLEKMDEDDDKANENKSKEIRNNLNSSMFDKQLGFQGD